MSEAFIYALVNPLTGDMRYIGKTIQPKRRFKQHLKGETNRKCVWLQYLQEQSLQPAMLILETVPEEEDGRERELFWVRLVLNNGGRLVNGAGDRNKATGTYGQVEFMWRSKEEEARRAKWLQALSDAIAATIAEAGRETDA